MTVPSPMLRAMAAAATVRTSTSPNPWVGCCLTTVDGHQYLGATEPPGGRHAERVALDAALAAGATLTGATVHVTLDRKSTRLNSSHSQQSRMPSSA